MCHDVHSVVQDGVLQFITYTVPHLFLQNHKLVSACCSVQCYCKALWAKARWGTLEVLFIIWCTCSVSKASHKCSIQSEVAAFFINRKVAWVETQQSTWSGWFLWMGWPGSSIGRTPDSRFNGPRFESRQEHKKIFAILGQRSKTQLAC